MINFNIHYYFAMKSLSNLSHGIFVQQYIVYYDILIKQDIFNDLIEIKCFLIKISLEDLKMDFLKMKSNKSNLSSFVDIELVFHLTTNGEVVETNVLIIFHLYSNLPLQSFICRTL